MVRAIANACATVMRVGSMSRMNSSLWSCRGKGEEGGDVLC